VYYSKEDIKRAKEIDLLSYLRKVNPNELVYDGRNTYSTKTHDSLKISNGMWYWFSRGIGGKTALEYLIQVEKFKFTDAVAHLIGKKIEIKKQPLTEKNKIEKLKLPQKNSNNNKIIYYLRRRGISANIIDECISRELIYQDYPYNNVIFVGYDDKNNPRYAGIRGTNDKRFMGESYGSDKEYSFKLLSNIKKNDVHLFESAIDLLSFATLKELKNEKWYEENLLSLAGIYKPSKEISESKIPSTLTNFLKKNSNIDTIFLHFDNDNAGRLATKTIQYFLSDSYKIIDDPPIIGKDFNDFLCYFIEKNKKNMEEKYR